jgi:hypothetical protein
MCPIGCLMLGSTLQHVPSDPPAACRSACRRRRARYTPGSLPTNDPRVHPAYPGRPRGRAGHCPTTSHDDGQVHTDASAGPAPPAPASSTRLPLRQTTSRAWTQRATTPTRPSQPYGCLPTATLQDLTSAGHSGRGNAQTPDSGRRTADTGQRTPDSGHLDAQTPAPDTGHRSRGQASVDTGRSHRTPDTEHRTLAEDVDRLTKARPASGPPGPPRRATVRWDAQPCSCGRRLRRSTAHAGSAVRPPSSAR